MRTTIDIPDALFREIKSNAASQGRTLKDYILSAVTAKLREPDSHDGPSPRVQLPLVRSKESSYDISPSRLAKILDEEDRELSA